MPELDLRNNPWIHGFPRDEKLIDRELFQLLNIFAASDTLSRRRRDDSGGCVYSWTARHFEYPEIGRILLSLAAILRSEWDLFPGDPETDLKLMGNSAIVGELVEDLDSNSPPIPLHVRESFNKILHADRVNLDRTDTTSVIAGSLNPIVYLYGIKNRKKWKATINIYRWAEVVFTISQ